MMFSNVLLPEPDGLAGIGRQRGRAQDDQLAVRRGETLLDGFDD
jgi:hypothetical protein